MTRINLVKPEELTNKHLLAEYRELPRVFALACKWYENGGNVDDLPTSYRMGKGHVKFFYNKLKFLFFRQRNLIEECLRRGFKINYTDPTDLMFYSHVELFNGYEPTNEEIEINKERIRERLNK